LTFEVGPHPGQPWQQVLVLGQFHLCAGVGGAGPHGENIKYEVASVDDAGFQRLFQVAVLAGG